LLWGLLFYCFGWSGHGGWVDCVGFCLYYGVCGVCLCFGGYWGCDDVCVCVAFGYCVVFIVACVVADLADWYYWLAWVDRQCRVFCSAVVWVGMDYYVFYCVWCGFGGYCVESGGVVGCIVGG